jgi:peptidyl-prolyl cis-trans isomerase C
LNCCDVPLSISVNTSAPRMRLLPALVALLCAVVISGCGNKDAKPGQALVKVGGDEVTVHQFNDELARMDGANESVRKQVLEGLIDRQLLQAEAARNKLDRGPEVMQAIERARAQILAQAYLKNLFANMTKPAGAEIQAYFNENPALFTKRKVFDMNELLVDSKEVNANLQAAMDTVKSIEDLIAWLEARNIQFGRRQTTRTTADVPLEMATKLQTMQKGQSIIVKQGERSLLMFINDVKDSPVEFAVAEKQIEQFLINKKREDAKRSEIARLRAAAKIEYLNQPAQAGEGSKTREGDTKVAPAAANNHIERGVAGLK